MPLVCKAAIDGNSPGGMALIGTVSHGAAGLGADRLFPGFDFGHSHTWGSDPVVI